ncbi:MAG: AbrB/MazE/SpoVT family DNA-binding domain-containing protein [Intrasporangium sp.]|uniref:AbrB/MazE/SpoVT family DNA-binding domain-containing protein n=1 Tax=Intrasporangium sp. TaxID=1925024 RepID=UPI002647150C|nr:AbrB/MazE/SpoVT family DNA-binding domain-containing protein [Intrasporangium sp.]MDN5795398.1 AbrB/MazE/SpoVT family DNA-binding domain-containing protein [Intrasporangium sp.]
MRTTIDAAGRVVVPKALRDAMRLTPGQQIDIVYTDGRLEIEVAPTVVHLRNDDGLPVAVPDQALPALSADVVRDVLEDTRR